MNADRIARIYRWVEYAAFGRALERARFTFLPEAGSARRVLIFGEGDGRFLARLAGANAPARICVIDASARMLELARQRVPGAAGPGVEYLHRNALADALPDGSFDLIVTNFFLDCFSPADAQSLIARAASKLEKGGRWLVAEFQEPAQGARRLHARLWLAAMYAFFRITTSLKTRSLPPYASLLASAGLVRIAQREWWFGLIVSQLWRKE
jgi:ubiquinone/menaquinone biosynthesis C-methylase UbiE